MTTPRIDGFIFVDDDFSGNGGAYRFFGLRNLLLKTYLSNQMQAQRSAPGFQRINSLPVGAWKVHPGKTLWQSWFPTSAGSPAEFQGQRKTFSAFDLLLGFCWLGE